MRIILIACASKKLSRPAPARELYASPLFRLNLEYPETLQPDKVFVLSAKYGFLRLGQVVEPYDLTLNHLPARYLEGVRTNAVRESEASQPEA